jgi:hypothetical protein
MSELIVEAPESLKPKVAEAKATATRCSRTTNIPIAGVLSNA